MRFFIDQDLYSSTILLLRKLGHDIVTAKELNMERGKDEDLLNKASEMKRIFVTRDKDFGALVFLRKMYSGVILVRLTPLTIEDVHKQLGYLLNEHSEEKLFQYFSVVESSRYRLRKIK